MMLALFISQFDHFRKRHVKAHLHMTSQTTSWYSMQKFKVLQKKELVSLQTQLKIYLYSSWAIVIKSDRIASIYIRI